MILTENCIVAQLVLHSLSSTDRYKCHPSFY